MTRAPRCVLSAGFFDGVHLGHAKILSSMRRRAEALGCRAVAWTFRNHPLSVLAPSAAPRLLMPLEVRLREIAAAGGCEVAADEFTPALAFRMVLSWLVPLNTQMIPLWFYPWALWFVPVYLLGILLFPPIRKAVRRFGWMAIAAMVLLFVAVEIVLPLAVRNVPGEGGGLYVHRLSDILQETVFYSVFMAAGALHSRLKLREKRDGLLALAILVLSVAGLWISSSVFGRTLDMQENKFPPNHVFLFYASAVMTLLYLALPVLKTLYRLLVRAVPPVDKWIALFSANSMTVFLYQPFAFWGTYLLLRRYGLRKTAWEPYAAILLLYLLVWLIILLANLLKAARNALARRLAG